MAVREFREDADLVMDVILKDGPNYFACDIPTRPFGDNSQVVSIWQDDIILIFPMDKVKSVRLYDRGADQ